MDALVACLLFFCPVIVYVYKTKDYETQTILILLLGMLIGSTAAGYITLWIIGKEKMWVGLLSFWLYAMYKALRGSK